MHQLLFTHIVRTQYSPSEYNEFNLHREEIVKKQKDEDQSAVDSQFCSHVFLGFSPAQTDERLAATDRMNFVDFQTDMVRLAKQIARSGNDMVVKAASNPAEVGALGHTLAKDYVHLAHEARGAIATCHSMEVRRDPRSHSLSLQLL